LKCVYLAAEDGVAANGIPEEVEEKGGDSKMDESVSSRLACSPRIMFLSLRHYSVISYSTGWQFVI